MTPETHEALASVARQLRAIQPLLATEEPAEIIPSRFPAFWAGLDTLERSLGRALEPEPDDDNTWSRLRRSTEASRQERLGRLDRGPDRPTLTLIQGGEAA